MSIWVTRDGFERLVDRALDGIPDELARAVTNVAVQVVDEPPQDQPGLLGLYVGVPVTERDSTMATLVPDQITIFRGPLMAYVDSEDQLVEQVRVTVVHEVAHHFGIDDARLSELGYD